MTVTLAQLGARALRKLGISVVADSLSPASAPPLTSAAVAARVLRELGIPVAESDRPAAIGTVTQTEIAARALRIVGANPATLTPAIASAIIWTPGDVGKAALLKLAVIASDETPATLDQAEATARASAVHDILATADYVTWPATAIPNSAFEYYVIMTANLLAPEFGKPATMEAFLAAESAIRQQALSGAYGQAIAEGKVAAAHEEANALGLVQWPVSAVPVSQAEAYVRMTAAHLAPIYRPDTPEAQAAAAASYAAAMDSLRAAARVRGMQARAIERVAAVHEELNDQNLVTWTVDTIPASMADAYAAMASLTLGIEGGKAFDPALYAGNIARIRGLVMGGAAGQLLAEQKVRAVHYSLEARGRTRWTLLDVPEWAEESYVMLAATLLGGPETGVKADPAWAETAERDLMRIVSLPSEREPVRAVYF